VITTANNQQQIMSKRPSKGQQSFKTLRQHNGKTKQALTSELDNEPLNIQAKSILNPSQKESSGFLNKIAL